MTRGRFARGGMLALLCATAALAAGGCAVENRLKFGTPETEASFAVKWRRNVGAVRDNFLPVVSDGRVCFADADGDVSLLNAADGSTAASFDMNLESELESNYRKYGVMGAMLEFEADAGLLSSSVGCGDGVVAAIDDEGKVIVYDEAGEELWRADLRVRVLSPPVVAGGRVFLRSDDRIAARALRKGTELWQYENPLRGNLHVRVENGSLALDDAVYAGFSEGAVVALRANNGEVLWENTVSEGEGDEEESGISGIQEVTTPIHVGEYVCAGAYQGQISCFNAKFGQVEWRRPFSTVVRLGVDASGAKLFGVNERGHLHAFDAETGEVLWTNEESAGASAPLVAGGAVVVGGNDGRLRAFDLEDGRLIAEVRLGVGQIPRVIAAGDGDVLATVDSGYLLGDGLVKAGLVRATEN